jgi:hypothetical protein
VTLLLAGALVAAIIFIAVTASSSPAGDLVEERDAARAEVQRLKGEERRLTGEVQKARDESQVVSNRYADFTRIANAEVNLAARRTDISKLIEQAPNANETTVKYNVAGWAAYRRTTRWPPLQSAGDWKSYVAENLEAQLGSLDALKTAIDRFIGGVGSAKPTPLCDKNHPKWPDCGN